MVKNGFSSLIRGIFYTIGKIIAFILIGLLIGFLAVKFNVPIKNLVMTPVYAAENYSGDVSYYVQQGTTTSIQSGYQSNMSGMNIAFPTQTYFTLNKRNLYYYFIKEIDVTNSAYNFQANHTYNIKFKFTMGSYIQRAISVNNGISPSYGPVTYCGNGTCTKTSSCSASPDNTCTWTIIYNSQTTHTGLTLSFGSIYDVDQYIFWNNSDTYDQGIRLDLSSIEDTTQSVDLSPIIDSQNQNTQDIINNNNQNTQDIINQINENNEKEIESQKVCSSIDINYPNTTTTNSLSELINGYLNSDGTITSNPWWRVSDFIPVSKDNTYSLLSNTDHPNQYYCLYNSSKSLISCSPISTNTRSITLSIIPNQDGYIRFSIVIGATNSFTGNSCKNGNQALSDDINDLNNTLKNDDLPDVINSGGGGGTYFDDINQSSDTPISDLLLLPLNLLNKVNENLSSSCSPYTIPFDFTGGSNTLTFPCINIESYVGSELWGIIDAMFCLFMIYNIFRLIIRYYDSWTSLDDTFHSLIKGGTN